MIIYNAFHSIGLFSVFDSDVIANADIYTGGFGAKFGGRISSIMDIKTRDGNKQKIQGMVGASPFGAKITLEGPLRKMNENGGGISYIVSMKHSYLEQTSKVLYDYIKGCEMLISIVGHESDKAQASINLMRLALDWFRTSNPQAYMILLD